MPKLQKFKFRLMLISLACAGISVLCAHHHSRQTRFDNESEGEKAGLHRQIEELELQSVTLEEAFNVLRRKTGAKLYTPWELCPSERVNRQFRIDLRIRHVSLERALDLLLFQYRGGSNEALDYDASEGVIRILPIHLLPHVAVTYDVGDIVDSMQRRAFERILEQADADAACPPPSPDYDPRTRNQLDPAPVPSAREEVTPVLVRLVGEFIDTESSDPGTNSSTLVASYGDQLVVLQPRRVQRSIHRLLQRMRLHRAAREQPSLDRSTHAASFSLPGRIAELHGNSEPLKTLLDQIAKASGANVVVDWAALSRAATPPETPVQLDLWDVSVGEAIGAVLRGAEREKNALDFAVIDDVIEISISAKLLTPRLYGIRDSLGTEPFPASETTDEIMRLVEDTIQPNSWRDNGGTIGLMDDFLGHLLVINAPEAHRQIDKLFRTLHAAAEEDANRVTSE